MKLTKLIFIVMLICIARALICPKEWD